MRHQWFKQIGWFYYPATWQGIIIAIITLIICINIFVIIDIRSHSASDTLYGIFPYFVAIFLLFNWVASKSIEDKDDKK